jgi:hypothetical protein
MLHPGTSRWSGIIAPRPACTLGVRRPAVEIPGGPRLAGPRGAVLPSASMPNPYRASGISGSIALPLACCVVLVLGTAWPGRADPPGGDGQLAATPDAAPRMTLASDNEHGTWTAELSASAEKGAVSALVSLSGPAGKTRRMGLCLVQQYGSLVGGVPCSTRDDCDNAPEALPAGGARYCVAPRHSATRICHFRPGAAKTYCAGSPAIGFAAIAPGAHRLEITAPAGTRWLAMVCFEGCARIPPLASPTLTVR